jgi:hypothetical protein
MIKTSFKQKIIQSIMFGFTYAMLMVFFDKASTGEFDSTKFLLHGLFFGVFMGFVLPMITEYFNKKTLNKIVVELSDDEKIKIESRANLNGGTGKIVLTNKRLIFKEKDSSKNNFVEIPLHQIIEVQKKRTLAFIDNIFIIRTDSKTYEFIVYENERNLWVSKINDFKT